ncbi:MAG TPA: hypothetical protein PK993_04485 [Clostridia bacterium]|jgi:hypothetical protein|nr:hypothetical protein [Clostridia bacterium]
MDNLFINNNLEKEFNVDNTITAEIQNNFLETNLGKTINKAIDLGIKTIMPDFIEKDIIDIKNTFISEGFESGINQVINTSIELGKNIVGVFNGNFTDLEQVEKALMKGGLIEGISNLFDYVLEVSEKNKLLSKEITSLLKEGKNLLIDYIENNIKEEFKSQKNNILDVNKNIESWNKYFKLENLGKMNDTYEKIQDELAKVTPFSNIINSAKEIENIQTLINNNNGNFEISKEQLELSKILI